jgi:hypothetical protein
MGLDISDEDQGKDHSQSIQHINKTVENFRISIWDSFGCPKIDKFGELICDELLNNEEQKHSYLIYLVLKFQQKSLRKYVELLDA